MLHEDGDTFTQKNKAFPKKLQLEGGSFNCLSVIKK